MSISQRLQRRAIVPGPVADTISANEMPTGTTSHDPAKPLSGDNPPWTWQPTSAIGGGVEYKPPQGPNATY